MITSNTSDYATLYSRYEAAIQSKNESLESLEDLRDDLKRLNAAYEKIQKYRDSVGSVYDEQVLKYNSELWGLYENDQWAGPKFMETSDAFEDRITVTFHNYYIDLGNALVDLEELKKKCEDNIEEQKSNLSFFDGVAENLKELLDQISDD